MVALMIPVKRDFKTGDHEQNEHAPEEQLAEISRSLALKRKRQTLASTPRSPPSQATDDDDDDDEVAELPTKVQKYPIRGTDREALVENTSLDYLRTLFHLPLVEAAKEVGICTTFMKKLCRKKKITRWPYRKLQSLESQREQITQHIKGLNPQGKRWQIAQRKLSICRLKKQAIYKDPNVSIDTALENCDVNDIKTEESKTSTTNPASNLPAPERMVENNNGVSFGSNVEMILKLASTQEKAHSRKALVEQEVQSLMKKLAETENEKRRLSSNLLTEIDQTHWQSVQRSRLSEANFSEPTGHIGLLHSDLCVICRTRRSNQKERHQIGLSNPRIFGKNDSILQSLREVREMTAIKQFMNPNQNLS